MRAFKPPSNQRRSAVSDPTDSVPSMDNTINPLRINIPIAPINKADVSLLGPNIGLINGSISIAIAPAGINVTTHDIMRKGVNTSNLISDTIR